MFFECFEWFVLRFCSILECFLSGLVRVSVFLLV